MYFPYIQSFLALRFFLFPFTPYPFFTYVNLVPFWDPGHIDCQNLMKFSMVACINILGRENWSTASCWHQRPGKIWRRWFHFFLHLIDHLDSICKKNNKLEWPINFGNFGKVKWHHFLKIYSPTTFIDKICWNSLWQVVLTFCRGKIDGLSDAGTGDRQK